MTHESKGPPFSADKPQIAQSMCSCFDVFEVRNQATLCCINIVWYLLSLSFRLRES